MERSVKSSATAKTCLVALLLLSLGGKIATTRESPSPDPVTVVAAVERLLTDAGFEAKQVHMTRSPGLIAIGQKDGCQILAGDYPPYDTFADVYARLAQPVAPLRYIYRGAIYSRPPKLRSLIGFYWWRELGRVGIRTAHAPVIAVAASKPCALERLPWQEISTIRG